MDIVYVTNTVNEIQVRGHLMFVRIKVWAINQQYSQQYSSKLDMFAVCHVVSTQTMISLRLNKLIFVQVPPQTYTHTDWSTFSGRQNVNHKTVTHDVRRP